MHKTPLFLGDKGYYKFSAATLYVPIGTKEKYEAIEGWKYFTIIIEAGDETTEGDVNGDMKVDFADVMAVINVIAKNGNAPTSDLNGDGKVDIADLIKLLRLIEAK